MTAVDLSLLADLLVGELERHRADPSPVRDPSENDLVDTLFRRDEPFAGTYVRTRLEWSLARLREGVNCGDPAWRSGDAVNDALIALGAWAHLRDLQAVNA